MSGVIYILDGRIYSCDTLGLRTSVDLPSPDIKYPHASVYCGTLFPIDYDSLIIKDWLVYGFDGITMVEGHVYKGVIVSKNTLIEIALYKKGIFISAQVNHIPIEPDMRYCLSNDDDAGKIMTVALMVYESIAETKEAIAKVSEKFLVLRFMKNGCNADLSKMTETGSDDPDLQFTSPENIKIK